MTHNSFKFKLNYPAQIETAIKLIEPSSFYDQVDKKTTYPAVAFLVSVVYPPY